MVTGIPAAVAAAVLGSAVLHASWNALAKAIPHRLLASALMGAGELVVAGIWCAVARPPDAASWPYLAISAVLQTGYLLLLTAAYARGEFGRVYPVARGTAPVLVTVYSLAVLGESLRPAQLAGIALVSAALAMLALWPTASRTASSATSSATSNAASRNGRSRRPAADPFDGRNGARRGHRAGLGLAVATGVVIAAYSLIDGLGVRHSGSAAGYAAWLMTLHGVLLVITCLLLAGPRRLAGWVRGTDGVAAGRRSGGANGAAVTGAAPGTPSTAGTDAPGGAPMTGAAPGAPSTPETDPQGGAPVPRIPAGGSARVVGPRARPAVRIVAGLAGGVLSLAAYTIVLWAQSRASLSLVSALRETSVLFAGVVGAVFFADGFSVRQTVAAFAVVGGIALIQVG